MKQFVAGDIGPGEMGCGIELQVIQGAIPWMHHTFHFQDVNPLVAKEREEMYQVAFNSYHSVSVS